MVKDTPGVLKQLVQAFSSKRVGKSNIKKKK
jgi:hypothetical protein